MKEISENIKTNLMDILKPKSTIFFVEIEDKQKFPTHTWKFENENINRLLMADGIISEA